MGRKPKPTAIKRNEGNPGKRPLNTHEPSAGNKLINPDFLGENGSTMWESIILQLKAMGVLDSADWSSIMLWCLAYEDLIVNREFVNEQGLCFSVIDGQGNVKYQARPQAKAAREAWSSMRGMLSEFGFTPAARVGLGSINEPEDEFTKLYSEMLAKKESRAKLQKKRQLRGN
ncbi:phage terminase small subunit P27 family [bacterium]|nr:phage terminase small subunit P27 family [bacterium]